MATTAQIKHIQRLMFELDLSTEDFLAEISYLGIPADGLEYLTNKEASTVISFLKTEAGEEEEEWDVEGL